MPNKNTHIGKYYIAYGTYNKLENVTEMGEGVISNKLALSLTLLELVMETFATKIMPKLIDDLREVAVACFLEFLQGQFERNWVKNLMTLSL
jgi:hypothetical protein